MFFHFIIKDDWHGLFNASQGITILFVSWCMNQPSYKRFSHHKSNANGLDPRKGDTTAKNLLDFGY